MGVIFETNLILKVKFSHLFQLKHNILLILLHVDPRLQNSTTEVTLIKATSHYDYFSPNVPSLFLLFFSYCYLAFSVNLWEYAIWPLGEIRMNRLGTVILCKYESFPLTIKVSGRQILSKNAQFMANSSSCVVLLKVSLLSVQNCRK